MWGHTSAAPIHDCPKDKHSWSSASAKCSESGRHAVDVMLGTYISGGKRGVRCKYPKLHYTLHWWLRPDWLDSLCLNEKRYVNIAFDIELIKGGEQRSMI